MRHALRSLRRVPGIAAGLLLFLARSQAQAQACHVSPASERDEPGFLVALSQETASFHNQPYEGHYQGLFGRIGWKNEWASAEAALPAYRIVRNGRAYRGLGDVHLDLRGSVLRRHEQALRAGLVLGASLPTGNARTDLGMGHPMIVPGVWGSARVGEIVGQLELGYGRALHFDDEAASHRHDPRPIVDPMNESELAAALSAMTDVRGLFDLRGGVRGAAPIGAENGASRASAFLGTGLARGSFRTSIDGHVPISGDPFDVKMVLEIAARL